MSLTLGVALATLVVAGAILLAPTIADCPGGSLAACLRDRVAGPSEPARPAGWIEAVATEYAPPPPPAAVTLAAPTGALTATAVPLLPAATPAVALHPPGGIMTTGATAGEGSPLATAALAAPTGTLAAGISAAAPPIASAVTLEAPEKTISSPIQVLKIEAELAPPVIRFDPAYPNVVVLPAPNTGADSSISTLDVR